MKPKSAKVIISSGSINDKFVSVTKFHATKQQQSADKVSRILNRGIGLILRPLYPKSQNVLGDEEKKTLPSWNSSTDRPARIQSL
jgi:phage repressor protein C with HTH and peptisase S24 domain